MTVKELISLLSELDSNAVVEIRLLLDAGNFTGGEIADVDTLLDGTICLVGYGQ